MKRRSFRLISCLVVIAGLSGCSSYEPLDYTPSSEIPPGPGLFSGEKGAFNLYGGEKKMPKDDLPPHSEN